MTTRPLSKAHTQNADAHHATLFRRYAAWSLTPDFHWIATATGFVLLAAGAVLNVWAVLCVLVGMAVLRMAGERT